MSQQAVSFSAANPPRSRKDIFNSAANLYTIIPAIGLPQVITTHFLESRKCILIRVDINNPAV